MKLIDHIGIEASQIDKRLVNLLKDVDVVDFEDCTGADLRNAIVIGDDIKLPMIFQFVEESGLNYLVQKKHDYYLYNLLMTAMIYKFPDVFIKSPITVMTRNQADDERTVRIPFRTTRDKTRIMQEAEKFINQNSKNSSIKLNLKIIISEFFSNAMYSAPTDEGGNYLYSHHPRNAEVTYPDGVQGEILLSFNNEIFAVACKDPYGSVNKVRVQKRLHQVFDASKLASVEHRNNENMGSGLGLKMVIENSIGFGMVVRQGHQTLVYATLPVGSGNKKMHRFAKNICFHFY